MIALDKKGFRGCPTKFGVDGGDTAVREGLTAICTGRQSVKMMLLENGEGVCVRNPWQKPWNNPNNFTKDQLKMLVAGFHAIGFDRTNRRIYEAHEKRGHCQNIERDFPGSAKGWFHRASDFQKLDEAGDDIVWDEASEFRIYDGPDRLLPNDWEFLKVGAAIKKPDGFGLWWHHQALKQHASGGHNEENQMFAECNVMGTLDDYERVNPGWVKRDRIYWSERNELEYHEMKVDFMARRKNV